METAKLYRQMLRIRAIEEAIATLYAEQQMRCPVHLSIGQEAEAAFASQLRGESRVTLSFFGEVATEEGVFHESINFASLKKLPVVFVCENNLYSVYTPMSVRQPAHREVFQQAVGHGVEAHQADGNSVEEVFRLTQAA